MPAIYHIHIGLQCKVGDHTLLLYTRLSSLKGKEKDVSKKIFTMYIAPLRPKTQRRFEDRQLNQARSKPDTVNRPVRTAHILCTIIIVHNTVTQTVFIYIPLPPDQHHISDVANWR